MLREAEANSAVMGEMRPEAKKSEWDRTTGQHASQLTVQRPGRLTEAAEHDDEVCERSLDKDEHPEGDSAHQADKRARCCSTSIRVPSTQRGGYCPIIRGMAIR